MGVWYTTMNLLNPINRQNITGWFSAEFIGAMRCADRNRKRVDLGFANEVSRLFRVGK